MEAKKGAWQWLTRCALRVDPDSQFFTESGSTRLRVVAEVPRQELRPAGRQGEAGRATMRRALGLPSNPASPSPRHEPS
jgi:hypothetical protein